MLPLRCEKYCCCRASHDRREIQVSHAIAVLGRANIYYGRNDLALKKILYFTTDLISAVSSFDLRPHGLILNAGFYRNPIPPKQQHTVILVVLNSLEATDKAEILREAAGFKINIPLFP